MKFGLGQPIRRREDVRFLKGEGQYVDDMRATGDLHAFFLRSPAGHARITGLDVSAARQAEGVELVLTAAEIEGRLNPLTNDFPLESTGEGVEPVKPVTMPHLATDRVRFVGQPVAMVVARTLAQARDAAELIELDLEELPVVVEQRAALEPAAPELHAEAPGNLAYDWGMGDAEATDAAFARAAKTVSVEVVNNRIVVASLEPRAARIGWSEGRWEIHAGTQGSHNLRAKLARQLGVDAATIRVMTPDVGGGFGMKLQAHPEDALIAIGARDLGATIRWTADRSEAFLSDAQGRDLLTLAEGAFDAEGKVLAMRFHSVSNLGAYYSTFGAAIHTFFSAPISGGMYDVPVWRHEVKGAFTNTVPTDAYRGAGRPEMIHVTEQLMETAARAFGADRAEFRKRNLITSDQTPYTNHGGCVFDSADPARNVDDALAAADWAGFEARRAEAAGRGKVAGIAAAYYFERTGGGPAESALMNVTPEGEITLAVGTQSSGQGHETVWPQIVHEELGVDPMKIRLLAGDSDVLTAVGGTGGSRSLIMASRVLMLAAEKVIEKAMEGASSLLEAARPDIEYSVEDGGRFRIKGTDRSVTLFEAAAEMGGVEALGEVNDRVATFPNGCHVAEVELDPETGAVEITRYSVADDFGRVVNPLLVEGQVHGGLVQGAGQVMGEVMVFDPQTAQPLSGTFMDYRMPRASDFPQISFKLNEIPCTTNPLGVKGCGEAGAVGAIPALAMAIQDALLSAGVGVAAPPFTPVRVWNYLNAA